MGQSIYHYDCYQSAKKGKQQMKIATLIQTFEGLACQGYEDTIGVLLDEHGLVIELKEPVPPEEEPTAVKASTFTPDGTQIVHPIPGKAFAVLSKDMIDKAEKETGDESQAASNTPREDVISASPDCSCEISVSIPTGYRVTLRGYGKVAAAFHKDTIESPIKQEENK